MSARRNFLKRTLQATALVGISSHPLIARASMLLSENEENVKARHAKYTFNFASPYLSANSQWTPHVHHEIKQLIEEKTHHNIHVNIIDGGQTGVGSSLVSGVKFGQIQGALVSISNLSPQVKALDILNIPFWINDDEEYLRVVHSPLWRHHILSKTNNFNLEVLFHYVVGQRTAASTKRSNVLIASPEDYKNIPVRIANSQVSNSYYQLAQSKPYPIAWKFCAAAARAGRFNILDPSIIGLYSGPDNLKNEIDTISKVDFAHDGWAAIANLDFINRLDKTTREQFNHALHDIQLIQHQHYLKANQACINQFKAMGVKFYAPDHQERQLFIDKLGHQLPAWQKTKQSLLGDNGMAVFDQLYEIAQGLKA